MFDKGKKRRSPRQSPYGDMPDLNDGLSSGQPGNAGQSPRSGSNAADVDEYMMRSIMGMPSGVRGFARSEEAGLENAGPDSIMLRIELPISRAEQLRALARDLDESPQTLARLWIMERLRELGSSRSQDNKSNGNSQHVDSSPIMPPVLPSATQAQPAPSAADVKNQLADLFIHDPDERATFNETYSFRQWGPYIAALALTTKGRRVFTLDDMRVTLREELMPTVYDTPGALDSDLVMRDAELGRPGDQMRPFACLQRVSPGVYSFLGFGAARAMRAAR